jgi:hypothetical protein
MLLDQLHCGQEYLCAGARGHEVLHVEKAWEDFSGLGFDCEKRSIARNSCSWAFNR